MRVNPLLRFSVLSATCLIVLGLVLGHFLAGGIRHRALVDARHTAALLADEAIRPLLRPADLRGGTISKARLARLNAVVAAVRRNGNLTRVKVWSRRGRLVYSDDPATIGKRFAVEKSLSGAFAGKPYVGVTDGTLTEQREERGLGKLVEVYVPLRFGDGDTPSGAFEIYEPYAPISAAITHDLRTLLALLAVGLGLSWLVLFRLVAGVSRALQSQVERSRYEAEHDPLTGLPNRRLLYERLAAAIEQSRRDGTSCALLIIDLDGFKELNDTLGHPVGDGLLRDLGPRLAGALGDEALLARLGGDEFAIVLSGSGQDEPAGVARALEVALDEPFKLDGLRVRVAASIGVARFPKHGHDVAALMQRADVAMYQAKRARVGWAEYDSERDVHSRERLAVTDELRLGIERRQLEVYYQPKSDLSDGRVVGVESLVRWDHPVRGLLAPREFLAQAEQAGLMRLLTMHVLERALEQQQEWAQMGLDLTVAVNLSVPDLLDARLPDDIAEHLARSRVEPRMLTLEITEDVVMTDPQRCAAVLQRLAALGVSLSLDDFGTGYSSLAHLRTLAVDELKIDRSFVSSMRDNASDAAIVRSTIELARALGLRVVGEGVEDGETWKQLAGYGCDLAQGYFVSRPVTAEELTPRLLAALAATSPQAAVAVG